MASEKVLLERAIILIEGLIRSNGFVHSGDVEKAVCFLQNAKGAVDEDSVIHPDPDRYKAGEDQGNPDVFYFVAYSGENGDSVTVIDLSRNCSWEREEWCSINNDNFQNHCSAIRYARDFARANRLKYEKFESRYDRDTSE